MSENNRLQRFSWDELTTHEGCIMWITLAACLACLIVGAFAGLHLGYYVGRAEIQDELRDVLKRLT